MLKKMPKEEYHAKLLPLIERFMVADREVDAADLRRSEVAKEIRALAPEQAKELMEAIQRPPSICEGCDQPANIWSYSTPALCGPCTQKKKEADELARIETRARELAEAGMVTAPLCDQKVALHVVPAADEVQPQS